MLKKFILLFAFFIMHSSVVQAANQVKVFALENFQTENPSESMEVELAENAEIAGVFLAPNTTIHCKLLEIVDPKRGKRNASFYIQPVYYIDNDKKLYFKDDVYAKYSRKFLSKEELKKIEPVKAVKNTALMVGDFFMQGISIAYNFTEGLVKNEKDNRIKSGVVNAYEGSALSILNEGEQLDIKKGDTFYLVFKEYSEKDE